MFEKATRAKLRFKAENGLISVEDLWTLPLTKLDQIAISLNKELKESDGVSFITESSNDPLVQLRFNIVKHIIDIKLAEAAEKKDRATKAENKKAILEIIAQKQQEDLKNKSVEELIKLAESL